MDGCKSLMLSWGLTGYFMVIHLADRLQQLTNQIQRKMNEVKRLFQKDDCENRLWHIIHCVHFFVSALNLP